MIRTCRFELRTLSLAIAALSVTSVTHADESHLPNTEFEPIVVTVSRFAHTIDKSPARINIISEHEINKNPIHNLDGVLQQEAAANVVTSGGIGQVASVFLRGTESKHTLVLRDGVRLNSATTGTASLNFLEVGDLDRIEVLKGPSSVLYGTDAIGGVVQLISKRPIQSGAFVSGVYAENNTRKHLIGASLVSETSGLSAQARLHRLKSDGTPVVGKQAFNEDAAFEQKGGSLRLGFDNDILSVSANYASNQGTSEYVDHPWGADYRELSHSFENQLINLTGALHLSPNFSLHARASKFTDDLHQHQSPDFVRSKNREAELYGLWYVNKDHSVLFGSTYRKLGADVLFYSAPYHEEVKSQGYFAQHKYTGDRLNTQLGIRAEDNQKYSTHTVGQGAIRYALTPKSSIFANVGSAFRSPTLNEMYAFGGNPSLRPEESLSYELGVDHKLGDHTRLGLSVYQTKVTDLINFRAGVYHNVNKAKLTGGELSLKWRRDGYFINAGYNYVEAKNETTGRELNRRPRHNGVLSIGYENDNYGVSTSLNAKSRSSDWQPGVFNPGYASVDIHGYWNINPHAKLFTNIENVGNVRYATAYEGSQPGVYYRNGGYAANIGVTFSY